MRVTVWNEYEHARREQRAAQLRQFLARKPARKRRTFHLAEAAQFVEHPLDVYKRQVFLHEPLTFKAVLGGLLITLGTFVLIA